MVMVGVFAWQLGGRALWLVPATFITVMALAGALGIAGIGVPFVEIGIAISVVVFGAIVAFDFKAPTAVAMGVVGLFAVFHGHAHGAEIPEDAGGVAYAAGFIMATALLHLAGIGAGFLIGKGVRITVPLSCDWSVESPLWLAWFFSLAFSDPSARLVALNEETPVGKPGFRKRTIEGVGDTRRLGSS